MTWHCHRLIIPSVCFPGGYRTHYVVAVTPKSNDSALCSTDLLRRATPVCPSPQRIRLDWAPSMVPATLYTVRFPHRFDGITRIPPKVAGGVNDGPVGAPLTGGTVLGGHRWPLIMYVVCFFTAHGSPLSWLPHTASGLSGYQLHSYPDPSRDQTLSAFPSAHSTIG